MDNAVTLVFALPSTMPSAEWLIRDARERLAEGHTPDDLRLQWAGAWDGVTEAVATAEVLGKWLGIDAKTIYASRRRTRADGSPLWPEPEPGHVVGKTSLWRFSAIVLNRAQSLRGQNFRPGGAEHRAESAS